MAFTFFDFFCKINAFVLALCLSPLLFLSYLIVRLSHSSWYYIISYLHPELNFVRGTTLRTLSDTHRNQGIIAVLLTVSGPINVEGVKRHLQGVVQRTNKFGNLVYPHLRDSLVTRFGTYAWQTIDNFDFEQNLIVSPVTFKGRVISDFNIQDYVSDIVSKYLPSGVPPWQMVIIPSTEQQHYILLRLHHILLTGDLTIGELLPIRQSTRYYDAESEKVHSLLRNVYKKLEHIPILKERFTEDLTNFWNEFVSNYDPLEKVELLKTKPGFFQFLAICLITLVSILKEYSKGTEMINKDLTSKIKFISQTTSRECIKRKVSLYTLKESIWLTINPKNIMSLIMKHTWTVLKFITIELPVKIYLELKTLYTCIRLQYSVYPRTTIGLIYNYVPLIYNAFKEVVYLIKVLFNGPRSILQEMYGQQDIIQPVTLCGRKVVAWSSPVRNDYVQEIARRSNVSETEIYLAACSAGIANYFEKIRSVVPKEIAITARNYNSEYIFSRGPELATAIGGMLCIDLPILYSKNVDAPVKNLKRISDNLERALGKQPLTYLMSILQTRYAFLSKLFPATTIGIFLRCLSLKYAVCFTEMTPKYKRNGRQESVWGTPVEDAIYWRPPQANICMSLCINQYGDHVTLGVMSDAQLAPHHPALVRNFQEYLDELASTVNYSY